MKQKKFLDIPKEEEKKIKSFKQNKKQLKDKEKKRSRCEKQIKMTRKSISKDTEIVKKRN